jgi:hypothetical protein
MQLQGGKIDQADRLFHSIRETYASCTSNRSDVRELIPEFFSCSDFLINKNGMELGTKQDGTRVDNVVLPPWANGSVDEFIRLHRLALESEYVSMHLHHWIDLIFGFKQRPPNLRGGTTHAVDACNVYAHSTYEGAVDLENLKRTNSHLYDVTIDQMQHFGQTPPQLLCQPHPRRRALAADDLAGLALPYPNQAYVPDAGLHHHANYSSSLSPFFHHTSRTHRPMSDAAYYHTFMHPFRSMSISSAGVAVQESSSHEQKNSQQTTAIISSSSAAAATSSVASLMVVVDEEQPLDLSTEMEMVKAYKSELHALAKTSTLLKEKATLEHTLAVAQSHVARLEAKEQHWEADRVSHENIQKELRSTIKALEKLRMAEVEELERQITAMTRESVARASMQEKGSSNHRSCHLFRKMYMIMIMIMMAVSCWGVFVVCTRGVCRIDMEKAIHAWIRMIPTPTKWLEGDLALKDFYPCAMDAKSTSISNMRATLSTLLPYSAASSSFGDNHQHQWTLENQHPKRYMKYVFRWKTFSRNAHTNGSAVFEHDTYMYVPYDNTAMA